MAKDKQTFCLEGQFEGFMAGGKSPFKYLSLRNPQGQHGIKLPKSVRMMLFRYLQVGDSIRVVGEQSIDPETGEPKLKAKEVVRIKPLAVVTTPIKDVPKPASPKPVSPKPKSKSSKILICQKSSCRKRGASQVCRAVETA
ncbi:MAG: (2Fe-2S) ferredoxin domain-containing protein, partial [Cyanobacteria bacterium P01_A01_bin.137]